MSVSESLLFDLVPGETLERLVIDGELFYYGWTPAREGTAGTIVCLHGVASNASRWEEFIETSSLRNQWNFLRFDLRGHGGNESAVGGTLERLADDLATIVKTMPYKTGPIVVIGHSLGAQIAMMTGARYPSLVRAMVLLDPLIQEALTESARKKMKWVSLVKVFERVFRFLNRLGIRRRLTKYSLRKEDERARQMILEGGKAFEEFVRDFSSPWNEVSHVHLATYLRDLLEVSRPTPPVSCLSCPVLVVAAETGVFTNPQRMQEWVYALKSGEFSVVHCAHWPLTECPSEIKATIEDWLARNVISLSK